MKDKVVAVKTAMSIARIRARVQLTNISNIHVLINNFFLR